MTNITPSELDQFDETAVLEAGRGFPISDLLSAEGRAALAEVRARLDGDTP